MEPKRLFDGGGSEMERLLISAGRSARPRRIARWRAGLAFALANVRASAGSALRPGERRWVTARWALVGVTTTALAWGAAHQAHDYLRRRAIADRDASNVVMAAPEPEGHPSEAARPAPAPDPQTGVSEVTPAPSLTSRAAAPRSAAARTMSGSRSIAREVDELDHARRLIGAGQGAQALDALDAYADAFPKGVLQQEATLLRAEALAASGDRERARKVAQRALILYPHSAHAQRFQSLADMR